MAEKLGFVSKRLRLRLGQYESAVEVIQNAHSPLSQGGESHIHVFGTRPPGRLVRLLTQCLCVGVRTF